tara:strand:+ start:212 stop:688 length:477 start_codon:yes stop_codon:yes gene_type:complete
VGNIDDVMKDGISFERKLNFGKEECVEDVKVEPEEPKVDTEYEARQIRLSKKHKQAKVVNYSGFAVNGTSVLVMLYGIQNIMLSPDTIEFVNLIETTFGVTIDYEKFANLVEAWKTHIISLCGSIQMFLGYHQQLRRRMKETDREGLFGFINDEIGKL